MSPDKLAEARGWLTKAKEDLRGAEVDLGASPPLSEDAPVNARAAPIWIAFCLGALRAGRRVQPELGSPI